MPFFLNCWLAKAALENMFVSSCFFYQLITVGGGTTKVVWVHMNTTSKRIQLESTGCSGFENLSISSISLEVVCI